MDVLVEEGVDAMKTEGKTQDPAGMEKLHPVSGGLLDANPCE